MMHAATPIGTNDMKDLLWRNEVFKANGTSVFGPTRHTFWKNHIKQITILNN